MNWYYSWVYNYEQVIINIIVGSMLMETWKINSLYKSLPFFLSGVSMIFAIGTEFFTCIEAILGGNNAMHPNYPVYLAMFLEIVVQKFFYSSDENQNFKWLKKLLIVVICYFLVVSTCFYNSPTLMKHEGFMIVNHIVCLLTAGSILLADILIILNCFKHQKPSNVNVQEKYLVEKFN